MNDFEQDELRAFQPVKAPAENLMILAGLALVIAIAAPIVWSS